MGHHYRWVVVLLLVMSASGSEAQFTYSFSTATPGYTNLSGGTNVLVGGSASAFLVDDAHSDVINLGFTFGYDGVAYTQVKVNSNGFISLETADVPATTGSNAMYQNGQFASTAAAMRPIICPL